MNGKRPNRHKPHVLALFAVIGFEVLVIAGLVAWGLMRPSPTPPQQAATNNTSQEPTLMAPSVALVQFATGLAMPVDIAAAPSTLGAQLYVVEQKGVVRSVSETGVVGTTPFLDITSKVNQAGAEVGLLGLAFHPKFAANNYLYVNYIDLQLNTIVARYTANKQTGLADPASEKVLLKLKQPFSNHNGGQVAFGPDGYLYIGLGDGGSGGDPGDRAQNKNVLFGKLLRLDVDKGDPYAIPSDNPYAANGGKPEIWALGLRNPWRFSFDARTGDLYIADVGQGDYEEINLQLAGATGGQNYGWRCFEGIHDFNTAGCQAAAMYVSPILEYGHTEGRCSVTGGYVYRGKTYPALAGKYFYGDYCGGQLYYAEQSGGTWKQTDAAKTQYNVSTFGQDAKSELYLADMTTGTIYRITDVANKPR